MAPEHEGKLLTVYLGWCLGTDDGSLAETGIVSMWTSRAKSLPLTWRYFMLNKMMFLEGLNFDLLSVGQKEEIASMLEYAGDQEDFLELLKALDIEVF